MSEHIDLDVSGILRREMTMDQAGDQLIDIMLPPATPPHLRRSPRSREFVMTKLYQSA